ncbi:hypothetical protein BDW22DRAFT_182045 [Trametopsis cervina]|nr:hypothetical protein BDW22DRAFT_182045 [Trametopsis cervina]
MVCTALSIDMAHSGSFNYGGYSSHPVTVKVEPDLGLSLLHSPPSSRPSSSARHSSTPSSRLRRKISSRSDSSIMTHPYGSWASSGLKNEQGPGARGYSSGAQSNASSRRGGSGDQQPFAYPDSYAQPHDQYRSGAARHHDSSASLASSLSGAMGELGMSSNTPPNASPSGMAWTPSPTSGIPEYMSPPPSQDGYVLVSQEGNLTPYLPTPGTPHNDSPPGSFLPYQQNNYYSTSEPSPPHIHGLPTPISYSDQFQYQQARAAASTSHVMGPPPLTGSPAMEMPMAVSPPPSAPPNISFSRTSRSQSDRAEDEVRMLRNRIHELERENKAARHKVRQLEQELAFGRPHATASGLPTPMPSPAVSATFEESWRARTEARVKVFCSLNRAGNALCAWHDSRRERRAHPPRMAPPGHLNCGCTYEEALFEESLARHGVGSYHPGESVRMDPALRNPLLKLLQQRYDYRDGDFERDPITGDWQAGEGPANWEVKAASGTAITKKHRVDERR